MIKNFLFLLSFSCYLFSSDYEIVTEVSNPEVSSLILEGLEDFNMKFFRQKDPTIEVDNFVIYAKDEGSKVIGGLNGYVIKNNLGSRATIDFAWVEESKRHQGIGTELFKSAETLARAKNCKHIQLFTWEYQAVDFYKKLGYECVGSVPEWIENYDAVFF